MAFSSRGTNGLGFGASDGFFKTSISGRLGEDPTLQVLQLHRCFNNRQRCC